MAFTLPALAYATDALEPHIDKMTMDINHGKPHQAYVTNLSKALDAKPEAESSMNDISNEIWKFDGTLCNNVSTQYNPNRVWTSISQNGRAVASWE